MKRFLSIPVIFLTLLTSCLVGCNFFPWQPLNSERCNNRAYIRMPLENYLSDRYRLNPNLRLGIIPFSVPANFTRFNDRQLSEGEKLAYSLHQKLLATGTITIIEILNPYEWSNKKEEFFAGNFTALELAKRFGFDLILVGNLNDLKSPNHLSATAKLIDVSNGVTLWYGESSVGKIEYPAGRRGDPYNIIPFDRPDKLDIVNLEDELTTCLIGNLTDPEQVP